MATLDPDVTIKFDDGFWKWFYLTSTADRQISLTKWFESIPGTAGFLILSCRKECQYDSEIHQILQNDLRNAGIDDSRVIVVSGGKSYDRKFQNPCVSWVDDYFEKQHGNVYFWGKKDRITRRKANNRSALRQMTALCLNKRTSIHRLAFVESLLQFRNGRTFISCPADFWDWTINHGEIEGIKTLKEMDDELGLSASRRELNGIGETSFYDHLPLVVDIPDFKDHEGLHRPIPMKNPWPCPQACECIFNYVTETKFFEPTTFVTEKTYRSFTDLTFPIILGSPHSVRLLREQGYRMDALDHSYDEILDPNERFRKVVELVKWTQEMGAEEEGDFYMDNIKDVVHNYNHFMDRTEYARNSAQWG